MRSKNCGRLNSAKLPTDEAVLAAAGQRRATVLLLYTAIRFEIRDIRHSPKQCCTPNAETAEAVLQHVNRVQGLPCCRQAAQAIQARSGRARGSSGGCDRMLARRLLLWWLASSDVLDEWGHNPIRW